MLDEIGYLIKGHDGLCKTKERFSWLCRMFEVCRERPIHFHGTAVSAEFLHAHFLIRLYHLGLDEFKKNVNSVLNSLRDFDEQLYYFVLVSSYRLPDMYLCSGIKSHFVENYQYPIELASSAEVDVDCSSLPRLLWDISPALDPNAPISVPTAEEPIEPGEICPLDARGMVTQQFSKLLAWDTFHSSGSRRDEGNSGRVHFLQRKVIVSAVLDLLAGVSSDIFQEKDGTFFLVTWCKMDCWSTVLTQAATSSILQLTNRIFYTQRAISDRNEGQFRSDKLLNATVSAVAEVSDLLRDRLLHISDDCSSNQRFFEDLFTILEAHSQFLDVCGQILQSPEIQIIQLIHTVRCIRDSMQYAFSRSAYDVILKALVRSAAISICVFVNTGRCDFADLVFIESVPAKVSPDRNDYGEIWESNFNVDLPSSPDFSARLCREVVKHGVLVKLLRGDIAGKSGELLHLLDLYGIGDSQMAVDLDVELLNVSSHVEEVLKDGVDTSTLENLVEWIMCSCAMFSVCCAVADAILKDVFSMCDVIQHLLLSAGTIDLSAGGCKHTLHYKLRAGLEAHNFDKRHISAVHIDPGHGTYRLMITPPEPLSIIITPGHARRYVRIYTFLADLTRAVSALEKVDLREPKVGLDNRRALFYCCILMLRLMAGTRDHVVTELDAAWEVFKTDLATVKTIDHAINAHRKAMKSMVQRTLLDMSNLTTGRTVGVMCESCVRFAQAMNAGDGASAFIHYRLFDEHAQLFREKLSVERTNMSARMLLWRIGGGTSIEEEIVAGGSREQ